MEDGAMKSEHQDVVHLDSCRAQREMLPPVLVRNRATKQLFEVTLAPSEVLRTPTALEPCDKITTVTALVDIFSPYVVVSGHAALSEWSRRARERDREERIKPVISEALNASFPQLAGSNRRRAYFLTLALDALQCSWSGVYVRLGPSSHRTA
jgi:hypothetical protein